MEKKPEDIFEGYDPEKVKAAIATYAGSWAYLDTDKMIEEIYAAREKGSRPATTRERGIDQQERGGKK